MVLSTLLDVDLHVEILMFEREKGDEISVCIVVLLFNCIVNYVSIYFLQIMVI